MGTSGRDLTAEQIRYLKEHSGLPPEVWSAPEPGMQPSGPESGADTLSVDEAAQRLDVQAQQVLDLVAHRELLAWRIADELRVPSWQFTPTGLLPHLFEVLTAFPVDLHPRTVSGFVTTPQDDLDGMTVVRWLAQGGDSASVAFAASALDRW